MAKKRLRAVVQGRVQGVGFRYWASEEALRLHLKGFVRNVSNGDVEIICEGEKGALEAFLVMLHRGPRMAHIDNVHFAWLDATGEFINFSIGGSYYA